MDIEKNVNFVSSSYNDILLYWLLDKLLLLNRGWVAVSFHSTSHYVTSEFLHQLKTTDVQ